MALQNLFGDLALEGTLAKTVGFDKNADTSITVDESGTTTTVVETDGVKTLTTIIDESANPISITKEWS